MSAIRFGGEKILVPLAQAAVTGGGLLVAKGMLLAALPVVGAVVAVGGAIAVAEKIIENNKKKK